MQETWVGSLGQDDPLEGEMSVHSSILAWEIPWTEEPGGLQSGRMRHKLATEQQQHPPDILGGIFHTILVNRLEKLSL